MTPREALEHEWLQGISNSILKMIGDKGKDIAVGCLRALRKFKKPDDIESLQIATRAIISASLLGNEHKIVLRKIFDYMDKSGDG